MVKIKSRQKKIAVTIQNLGGGVAADIGSDHGYLPIYLYSAGISPKIFASDISAFSIEKINNNILKFKIPQGKIMPVLSNGLDFLSKPEFADITGKIRFIIMSGLGGEKIFEIINGGQSKSVKDAIFILQPNTGAEYLRKSLWDNGFEIKDESLVYDGGRIYVTITALFSGETQPYSAAELLIGKNPAHDALFEHYKAKILIRLENILTALEKLPQDCKFTKSTEFGCYHQVCELISDIRK